MVSFLLYLLFLICFPFFRCLGPPIVNTTSGSVRGKTIVFPECSVNQFLNIPYAVPPVGSLRFSKPIPLMRPKNIIDGTALGNACIQTFEEKLSPESEDCLYLNVWTRYNSGALKPVLFYIHGGSLLFDSIISHFLNGSALAMYDMVIVTTNYRVGAFGWLYGNDVSAPGNVGFYDQLLALRWTRHNIHNFGGDPNHITILGHSAGSWCTSAHILSPLSRGLFKKIILGSGVAFHNKNREILPKSLALKQSKQMAKHFNCREDNQWLDCLRGIDSKTLSTYIKLTPYLIFETEVFPMVAQKAFELNAYNKDVDILLGTMRDEGSVFGHYYYPESEHLQTAQEFKELVQSMTSATTLPFPDLFSEKIANFYLKSVDTNSTEALKLAFFKFYGDLRINCPSYFFATQFASYTPQRNVYFFYWTYISRKISEELGCAVPYLGVCHKAEVPYVFGEPVLKNMPDMGFSYYVMKMWTNFAKYGNPLKNMPANFIWPRFVGGVGHKVKEMNPFRPNNIIENLFTNNCEYFWNNYYI